MAETKPPKVFISYAWEDDLKTWVLDFATRLRSDGINAILDQWETVPGDQLPEFMEKSVRESDFVVFVCTPTYKRKSDRRKGGVGYEGHIITGEVFQKNNHRKFIPVLRKGKWATAAPSWATSKLFIDLRGDPYREANYQRLLDTLFGKSPTAPPVKSDLRIESTDSIELIEKIADEKRPPEPKEEKPKTETPKSSTQKVDVGGDVSDSVIVTGSNNVINVGIQEAPSLKPEKEKFAKPIAKKEQPKKSQPPRKPNSAIIVALIGLVGTIVAALLSSPVIEKWFSPAPAPTDESATATFTLTVQPVTPSTTVELNRTPTKSFTPTVTPLPTEITDAKGVQMVLVSAGEFTMGHNAKDAYLECSRYYLYCRESSFEDVEPSHRVYLDTFYIDKFEVTNAQYGACVEQGTCEPPRKISTGYRSSYYTNVEFAQYPVVNIDWMQAVHYCEWRQSNLPTEAQWEKSARGEDNRTYPWGEGLSCLNANYQGCEGDVIAVGNYDDGKSPYGAYGMIGNVYEWVTDWYSKSYYAISPIDNPLGPDSGQFRVIRGGSAYSYVSDALTTYSRARASPGGYSSGIGFRCAKDAIP